MSGNKNLKKAVIAMVFQTRNNMVNAMVQIASNLQGEEEMLTLAQIPAYLVWGRFKQDLDAGMVYKWLMDSHHLSLSCIHALTFL